MKRLYIAGPYSADNVIQMLDNIRRGQRMATRALLAGFAPFCPWLDFHFQLMLRADETLEVEDYYEYSMAWLRVSDAVLMIEGWPFSKGAVAEKKEATRLNIPIFYGLFAVERYFGLSSRPFMPSNLHKTLERKGERGDV